MELKWLKGIEDKIFEFVLRMSEKDFAYFRYSLSGDLYGPRTRWGLGQLVFATRILCMIDKLKDVDEKKRKNLTQAILSFQKSNGYIYDPLISKLTVKARVKEFLRNGNFESLLDTQTKRAETRQSFAALFCLNGKPKTPFLHIPYTEERVRKYLQSMDWKQPWASGSHFSHLLFFYKANKELFNFQPDLSNHLIDCAVEWVNQLQSKTDGSWYEGDVPLFQKINGAMKILTGFSVVHRYKLDYIEKLIDTCLSGINDAHACNNFNIVYVLYYCCKLTDYRRKEIEQFCLDRLNIYKEFYCEKVGGFSFLKNKANDVYYKAKISKGLNEPDIHGTVMFVWGITLISKILKLDIGLREPIA